MSYKNMKKTDNRIQVRLKEDQEKELSVLMELMGINEKSAAVRQLLRTGMSFWKTRTKKIKEIKEDVGIFTIKPEELYPDIQIKRKYLGR